MRHQQPLTVLVHPTDNFWSLKVLNIGYQGDAVFSLPGGTAVIDGLVQSAAVRSAGFYIVDLYETAPSLHILYIFMVSCTRLQDAQSIPSPFFQT